MTIPIHDFSTTIEAYDQTELKFSAAPFERKVSARDKTPVVQKLINQFIQHNASNLKKLGVALEPNFEGEVLSIKVNSGIKVGAIPLISPITYKQDFNLIVRPRFGWNGIGPAMLLTGLRVMPKILPLPQLSISEKKIPPWLLSTVILSRVEGLLKENERNFEFKHQNLSAPKGQVNWSKYITQRVSKGNFLSIPCKFPELGENKDLLSVIHHILKIQKASLESQREIGIYVLRMIEYCDSLINVVSHVPPMKPSKNFLKNFNASLFNSEALSKGLEAIEWTIDEKGLAGIGDLSGLPWSMSMESLFEAYIEAICAKVASKKGGNLTSGRNRETIKPIEWDPPYVGSQKYLLPDVIIEQSNETIIIDAKYKNHWEDLNWKTWNQLEEEIQNRHRQDLFQVLSYAVTRSNENITCCLVYPCSMQTYRSLEERERLFHKASINRDSASLNVILTAIPFEIKFEAAITHFVNLIDLKDQE